MEAVDEYLVDHRFPRPGRRTQPVHAVGKGVARGRIARGRVGQRLSPEKGGGRLLGAGVHLGPVGQGLGTVAGPGAQAVAYHRALRLGRQRALPFCQVAPHQRVPRHAGRLQHQRLAVRGYAPRAGRLAAVQGIVAGHLLGGQVRAGVDGESHRLVGPWVLGAQGVAVLQPAPRRPVVDQFQLVGGIGAENELFQSSSPIGPFALQSAPSPGVGAGSQRVAIVGRTGNTPYGISLLRRPPSGRPPGSAAARERPARWG